MPFLSALEIAIALITRHHMEAGHSVNTNCYYPQRFRCLMRCRLKLFTYRSASLVTNCGDVCQTSETLLVCFLD